MWFCATICFTITVIGPSHLPLQWALAAIGHAAPTNLSLKTFGSTFYHCTLSRPSSNSMWVFSFHGRRMYAIRDTKSNERIQLSVIRGNSILWIGFQHYILNIEITHTTLHPLSDTTQTSMVENLQAMNILRTQAPSHTAIQQKQAHRGTVHRNFHLQ